VPGFFAETFSGMIGVAGAVLLGFLALSALTLVTFAWHPLQRLERMDRRAGGRADGHVDRSSASSESWPKTRDDSPGSRPPDRAFAPPRPRKERKAKRGEAPGDAAVAVMDEESDLPPVDLLTPPSNQDIDAGEAQLDRLGQSLIETLRTFKVEGRPGPRTTGPVVTQFEVVPAPGVKAGRIGALADDLAIAMRVPSVRVAPIPGKGAVGVEIPNPTARIVTMRELFDTGEWESRRAVLPIALGHDLEGKPVIADLTKMPHLLIAGATGTGKSVTINTVITSLIYRYTQKHLRFLMIDPKMVELSMYNALPHLRHKVVTNNHDAATVLKWAVMEMQRRYELLQANGARNIGDFNRKVEDGKPLRHPPRPKPTLASISAEALDTPPEPPVEEVYTDGVLPFIILIIDELADLMMTVQGEVETPLAILAQKARGHPAALGECDHRSHQGQFSMPHCIPRCLEGGQPYYSRPERCRGAARQRRHAVHAAGKK
jgi:S-DNA-T family DNA segregation ATPase FtsK/SpoIIIE